jgi:hypothetical protein
MNQDVFNELLLRIGGIVELMVVNNNFEPTIKNCEAQINNINQKKLEDPANIQYYNDLLKQFNKSKNIFEAINQAQKRNDISLN